MADLAQLHRLHNLVEQDINCTFRQISSAIDVLAPNNLLETLVLAQTYRNDALVVAGRSGQNDEIENAHSALDKGSNHELLQCLSKVQQS